MRSIFLEKNHGKQMGELMQYAFTDNRDPIPEEETMSYLDNSVGFGIFEIDQLVTQVLVPMYEFQVEDQIIKATGIAGVASYPEVRGKGYVNRIFADILNWEKEHDFILSFLAPFSYPFYAQFGYEHIYNTLEVTWDSSDFPAGAKTNYQIKRMPYEEAYPHLDKLYHEDKHFKRFGMKRPKWRFDGNYGRDKNIDIAVCFNEADKAVAYVVYRRKGEVLTILEIVTQDMTALLTIVRYIKGHGMSFKRIVYESRNPEASEVPLLSLVKELYDVDVKLIPSMMMRIVNVPKFLEVYPYRKQDERLLELTIEVKDRGASWNCGIFTSKGESVKEKGKYHLQIRVEDMAALFSGFRTIEALVDFGSVEVENEETISLLMDVLINKKPVISDFF